jgi:hypothetical protein
MHHDSESVVLFFLLFPRYFRTVYRLTANVPSMGVSVSCGRGWHLERPSLGAVNILAQVLADVP